MVRDWLFNATTPRMLSMKLITTSAIQKSNATKRKNFFFVGFCCWCCYIRCSMFNNNFNIFFRSFLLFLPLNITKFSEPNGHVHTIFMWWKASLVVLLDILYWNLYRSAISRRHHLRREFVPCTYSLFFFFQLLLLFLTFLFVHDVCWWYVRVADNIVCPLGLNHFER